MRRRRGQNPLLVKTIGIGIVVAAVALPILAELGAFKQLHEAYIQTQLINLPPPPPQPKERKPVTKKTIKSHIHAEEHHGPAQRATRSATVSVHVAAAKGTGPSSGNEPTIVNTAPGGPIGVVPTGPKTTQVSPQTQPVAPTPVISPPPTAVIPPVVPAVVEAEPVYEPKPVIPDDLLDDSIDQTFFGYFTIHADGSVDVKMVQSTGNSILDRLAIDSAKQWKFTPATRNGIPVDSYRRLEVEFVVS